MTVSLDQMIAWLVKLRATYPGPALDLVDDPINAILSRLCKLREAQHALRFAAVELQGDLPRRPPNTDFAAQLRALVETEGE